MAPVRTHDTQAEASTSQHKHKSKDKSNRSQRRHNPGNESTATPGISKIKSSLRQTRRLLAKDKLAADVRVETERRLQALETDLAQAEVAKKERTLATRYHKIKFFERQKVVRKITQTNKQLSSTTDKANEKQLKAALHDLRIDLNYILNYPKLRKYISLFPPENRKGQPGMISKEDAARTVQAREEVRSWVRSCMEKGELPKEPELHLSSSSEHTVSQGPWQGDGQLKKQRKSMGTLRVEAEEDQIEQDEFFGDDEERSS